MYMYTYMHLYMHVFIFISMYLSCSSARKVSSGAALTPVPLWHPSESTHARGQTHTAPGPKHLARFGQFCLD